MKKLLITGLIVMIFGINMPKAFADEQSCEGLEKDGGFKSENEALKKELDVRNEKVTEVLSATKGTVDENKKKAFSDELEADKKHLLANELSASLELIEVRNKNPIDNKKIEDAQKKVLESKKLTNEAGEKIKKFEKDPNGVMLEDAKKSLEDFEKSESYKKAMVFKKYKDLVDANNKKLAEIGNRAEMPPEIIAKQKEGNLKYCAYLKAQAKADICNVGLRDNSEAAKKTECANLKKAAEAAGAKVREILAILTKQEILQNQEKQFNVSGLFTVKGNSKKLSFTAVSNKIADWMITLVGSVAVTALIIGGFMMVISGGDENRLETGKTIFSYSIIGVTVTVLAYGIIRFIQSLFY